MALCFNRKNQSDPFLELIRVRLDGSFEFNQLNWKKAFEQSNSSNPPSHVDLRDQSDISDEKSNAHFDESTSIPEPTPLPAPKSVVHVQSQVPVVPPLNAESIKSRVINNTITAPKDSTTSEKFVIDGRPRAQLEINLDNFSPADYQRQSQVLKQEIFKSSFLEQSRDEALALLEELYLVRFVC